MERGNIFTKSDKTVAVAASRLIPLAAERLAVASCHSSSSSGAFKSSQQWLFPLFVAAKRKPTVYGILSLTENPFVKNDE